MLLRIQPCTLAYAKRTQFSQKSIEDLINNDVGGELHQLVLHVDKLLERGAKQITFHRRLRLLRSHRCVATASVAIDGSKFKAVNNRDKNFTRAKVERRRGSWRRALRAI
jgi:hypothetical protein